MNIVIVVRAILVEIQLQILKKILVYKLATDGSWYGILYLAVTESALWKNCNYGRYLPDLSLLEAWRCHVLWRPKSLRNHQWVWKELAG